MPLSPEERFTSRVADYVRHRPGYPRGIEAVLAEHAGLRSGSEVADIGSGTGIFTAVLLAMGCRVFAVEPNDAMRAAADAQLGANALHASVAGTAEATTLPDGSVDAVVAAQAFHWFRAEACRREFDRILRPGGRVALVWNERLTDASAFLAEYEQLLLDFGTDYARVRHENVSADRLAAFFHGPFRTAHLPNSQWLDFDGLRGRLLSCSYVPAAGAPGHGAMLLALRVLFDRHQVGGGVDMLYRTAVHTGQ